jgi:hypothetical protein
VHSGSVCLCVCVRARARVQSIKNSKRMFYRGTSYTANRYECLKCSLKGSQHFNVLHGKTSYVGMSYASFTVPEVVSQYCIALYYDFQTFFTICTGRTEANSW